MKTERPYKIEQKNRVRLPLFGERVSAGFPSPAESYIEEKLDLNEYLVKSPGSTYFVRAFGDSMNDSIHHEDILIVDKSLTPRNGDIIIAAYYGEFLVKEYVIKEQQIWLFPFNSRYEPIRISGEDDFSCFGVVTHAIHSFRG